MCRPVLHCPRYRARLCRMPKCSRLNAYDGVFGDPNISRHWVVHTRLAAFNLSFAAVHFQMTDYCASRSGDGQVNYRRLHDQQLTPGQFVLLHMQTWKWNTLKMFQMSTMLVSQPIKIKAIPVCSSIFDKRWRDGVPSTGNLLCASCHQLNIKGLWRNHNPCHICRGYCNVAQSFDRLKSWKIDISSRAVKQLVQQTPLSQTWHCSGPPKEDAKVLKS